MPNFTVTIHVFIKSAVLNPEEVQTKKALHMLDFKSVSAIQMGKCFIVSLETRNAEAAEAEVSGMCKKLLVNDVVERFEIIKIEEIQSVATT